jgi:5-methylcytosine-specific restriction protein A
VAWSRESRHARGYGTAWDKLRKRILARDKHLCQPCMAKGRTTAGRIVDHITAKAHGGTDDPGNLQVICDECNKAKVAEESGRPLRKRVAIALDGWPVEE